MHEAVRAGADLEAASHAALEQRVSPLLWRALEAAQIPTSVNAASWLDDLRDDAMRCRAQALLLQPRFASVALSPLHDAGLEPLVVKGAALAERYPGPGLRPMDDVDLILPAAQHRSAVRALEEAGWRVAQKADSVHHETALVHPGLPGLPVELHRELATWRERTSGLTIDQLWQRKRPVTIHGAPAFGLDPEDELVMLVTHAGKPYHFFGRLIWIVDVAVLIQDAAGRGRPIDWDRVELESRRSGAETMLAVALVQAARLGADSPHHLRRPHADGVRRRALEPLFEHDWPVLERDATVAQRLRYAVIDGRARRASLFVGQVLAGGIVQAPAQFVNLTLRAARRWWQLRGSDGSDGSDVPEQGRGPLEP